MDRKTKVTTRVTRTVTVEMTDAQVEDALRKACGFDDRADVQWDIGEGYIRSVAIVSTMVEES